jgi:diguanylate cyclase (GGDEF)-like protein
MKHAPTSMMQDLRARLRWRSPRLRFDDALEQHFETTTAPARIKHFVLSGTVALIIYNGFLAVDWIMANDVFTLALWVRLAFFTPIGMAILLAGARFPHLILKLPPAATEWVVVASGVLAALTLDVILTATSNPLSVVYRAGFVPVLVYGNLVQRLRFRGALVLSISVAAIYLSSLLTSQAQVNQLQPMVWPLSLLVIAVAVYTLISNYRMEYVERQRFLASERTKQLGRQLKQSHEQLEVQARSDALTGVANRRHFDAYLEVCWARLQESGGKLSLLLIDIDHFKAFNDRYGHPAGDECLRYVARSLQAQVPESIGILARWGGEEFAVVLPHFNATDAETFGQTLCDSIRALGLRHEASGTCPTVTISVGVACVEPRQCPYGPAQLVEAADTALYRAKDNGRNRVEVATAQDAVWA